MSEEQERLLEICRQELARRLGALLGAAAELSPLERERWPAEGEGVLVSGRTAEGAAAGRFEVFLDGPAALSVAGTLVGRQVERIEECLPALSPWAGEVLEAMRLAAGLGPDDPPGDIDSTRIAAPPAAQSDGWRGWSIKCGPAGGAVLVLAETAPALQEGPRPPGVLFELELPFHIALGSVELPLSEIQKLEAGSIVPLGRAAEGPVQLVVGGRVIARGELVVVDGCFGIRVQAVETAERRLKTLARV